MFVFDGLSQCAECTPDNSCGDGGNYPAVCPMQVPDAVAGEYYEQVLTFYIPTVVVVPPTNTEATIISVNITSVTGMPFGLTYTLDDEDGVYYPGQGQHYGCATLCGTPILPGNYNVNISVSALVTAFGIQITQTENFPSAMNVLPGAGSTSSFVYNQAAGCGSVEANFSATIVAPAPAVTTYQWDFGNGQTSSSANPPTVIYDTEGDYPVTLTTTVAEYKLQTVTLSNVASGWGSDIEDLIGAPDPYFTLTNGSGSIVFTSSIVDNTSSNEWNNLNIPLESPPYSIHFMDDDVISSDDDLGTAAIQISEGIVAFSSGTGTVGTVNISLDTTTQITDEANITVFPIPDSDFTVDGNTLICNDLTLMSYLWYRNGTMIPNATQSSYTMTEGGQYYCEVQNEYGCVSTSPSHLYCAPVSLSYDAPSMEIDVPNVYTSYQWYFNGLPIEDATTYYVSATQSGNYSVVVTTNYGCTITSEVYTLVVGVDELSPLPFTIFPNPVTDHFIIQSTGLRDINMISISDVSGKIVWEKQIKFQSDMTPIDVSNLAPGIYTVLLNNHQCRIIKK